MATARLFQRDVFFIARARAILGIGVSMTRDGGILGISIHGVQPVTITRDILE